jgi:uncharacterized protein with PQ loop repeat
MLSGIVLAYSYIPQIKETRATKNVDGINKSFWILISTALLGLTVSTGAVFYYFGTWGNFVLEIFNFGLAFYMLTLVQKYKKK